MKEMFDSIYVFDFMVNDLKLVKNELLVYALIYTYSNYTASECFYGTQSDISDMLNISRQTANTAISNLIKKGYIEKKYTEGKGHRFYYVDAVQWEEN